MVYLVLLERLLDSSRRGFLLLEDLRVDEFLRVAISASETIWIKMSKLEC